MQINPRASLALKIAGLIGVAVLSGLTGAALASHFGTSSISISYVDFISVVLSALGVLLMAVTLFVAILAVIGWTSIESKLRAHSIEFIGSELRDDKPLAQMVKKAVRDAVYEGVAPADEDEPGDEPEREAPADEIIGNAAK
jgi:hypothetical protein